MSAIFSSRAIAGCIGDSCFVAARALRRGAPATVGAGRGGSGTVLDPSMVNFRS
jgi:hypothetical protein